MHKKLLNKATSKLESLSLEAQAKAKVNVKLPNSAPLSSAPSTTQVYQYRRQRGVNLGSLFALETWLVPSLFQDVKHASSEMDLLEQLSANQVRERLEHHWDTFVNEGDWVWLQANRVNTVRLPIGYVHYCAAKEPELLKGTEYEAYADVYAGAWQRVEKCIQTAHKFDIGVLVDLHCAPGAQNADGHSGLSGGKVNFWDGPRAKWNQQRTLAILVSLASAVAQYTNVVGLELLNEPRNSPSLQSFYESCLSAIRARGEREATLPIYVGDAWDAQWYTTWAAKRKDFVVVDVHVYRCFVPSDHRLTAREHAATMQANGAFAQLLAQLSSKAAKGAAQHGGSLIVGEWSAALHHTSLPSNGAQHAAARAEWAQSQADAFERHCAGSFFWTLKKEGPPDPAWGYYSAVEQSVLPSHSSSEQGDRATKDPLPGADELRTAKEAAFAAHAHYWDAHGAATTQRWRFNEGFQQGWTDANAFARHSEATGGSSIGFAAQWVSVRLAAHCSERGGTQQEAWEFTVGCLQGIGAFEQACAK